MGSYDEQGAGWRKGPWTPQEDELLLQYINYNGEGRWSSVSKCTGLNRSGKSCRLRWVNYLRPGLKKGHLTPQEEAIVIELHALWGNKWSTIARYLPGRTDNEIKNYWRTHFKTTRKSCDQTKQEKSKKTRLGFEDGNIYNINDQFIQGANNDYEEKARDVAEIEFSRIENQQFLPMVDQETATSDFIPFDCYLWGGLWNLDDQNQVDWCSSFEGNAADYNVQFGVEEVHY